MIPTSPSSHDAATAAGARGPQRDGAALPSVTVVMPVRNEAECIAECLGRVLRQDYPADRLEVIVADGMSDDGTREIVEELRRGDPRVRLLDNPRRTAPAGLNTAIPLAAGNVIVRVDGHASIEPDYVRQCVSWLERTGADCVGGAIDSVGQGYVARTIALAMSSPFGVGGSGFRVAGSDQAPVHTDTLPFGAYRRDVFERVGLFNESMIRHQDYEFCYRVRRSGGKLLLLPFARVQYFVRSSLRRFWRQYWQYGLWKGRFLRAHPESLRLRHAIPPALVLALGLGLAGAAVSTLAGWLVAALGASYAGFVLLASVVLARRGGWPTLWLLPVVLASLHLLWGAGVWAGLLTGMKQTPIAADAPERVNSP